MPDHSKLQYVTYYPKRYTGRAMPLLVFLHGSGEAGSNLAKVMGPGPWQYANSHPDFPFIIVAPQQPSNVEWDPVRLKFWLDVVEKRVPVDRHRIYITGLSLGGAGAWSLAVAFPRRFAAIAPISGYAPALKGCSLRGNHIWAFHARDDFIVPLGREAPAVDRAKACGVDVKYTIYPNNSHDAWDTAYADPKLYAWLLSHKT